MNYDFKILFIGIISMISLAIFIFTVLFLIEKNIVCPNFGKAVTLETKYNFFGGGCFVKTNNQWIQIENYWNSPVIKK